MICLCYFILMMTDWLIIADLRKMSLYSKYLPREKKRRVWWKIFLAFAIAVVILLTVGICLPRKSAESGISAVMWILYTVLSVEFSQIVYSIFSLLGFIPKIFGKRRWNTGLWIGLPLGVMVFSMMWWGVLIGRREIETVSVDISSPKLPESFNGYKIAQVSDLHLGTWGNDATFISHLVDSVNSLKPDLIVFTGDIVNREFKEILPFLAPLSRLKAPDGVISILGNHDYGDYVIWPSPQMKAANLDSLKKKQEEIGWKMLNNTSLYLSRHNDSIAIIGVENWGEPPFTKYGDLNKAYPADSLYDGKFKILLSHNPEHWNQEVSKSSNIDLTLSGHTHAMQSRISIGNWKWSPAKYRYPLWGGLYSRENPSSKQLYLYVNIGAGEVGIPMRIGASPEITLFTLRTE